jgi:ABC-2 type transport system permease protein
MAESSPARQASGSIYDLGYRSYDGPRLGRSYAFTSLFWYSFVSIWGIGRSFWAKFFPFALFVIAMVPAIILLAIAALVPAEFEVAQPEEYYGFVAIVLALFCAIAAPELIGRDQRQRTLALYFSRALSRLDYAAAKLGALILSLFLVLVIPQIILQVGNAVAADSLTDYIEDNLDIYPPVFLSSLLVALFMGTFSMAIAIQTSRRAFSTGSIIASFVILSAIASIFVATLDGDAGRYAILLSPVDTLEGMTFWIFGAEPPLDTAVEEADLDGFVYLATILTATAVATGVVLRRILRMNV